MVIQNFDVFHRIVAPSILKSLAILTPQGTWFGASGFSNLKNQTAMRAGDRARRGSLWEHRFNIASVSKMFTATTVLSLVDEGKLSLEDTLDKWLPASVVTNIANGKDITIRQLLNHTSGIPDYFIELKLSSAT